MQTKKEIGAECSLDTTTAPPTIMKRVKKLALPDYIKWEQYDRKAVIPFTINPADMSRPTPHSEYWKDLRTMHKKQRLKRFFLKYNDFLIDYFICYEFSPKGRFHCHGLMYYKTNNSADYYHLLENLKYAFGTKRNRNACYKGSPFNSMEIEAFNKSFNYVTKDIQVMFSSKYKIKYTSKDGINKIKTYVQRHTKNLPFLG